MMTSDRTFDRWELAARRELADRGIGFHEANPLIEDARGYHAESGQDPWTALGDPAEFAAEVAAAVPAGLDVHGKSPRDYFSDAAFALAWFAVLGLVLGAVVAGGLTIPVTVAGAAGALLSGLAVLAAAVPAAARAAGRPGLAPWGFVLCGVLVVAAGCAFTLLPRTHIGDLPVLLALLLAMVGAGWLLRPTPEPKAEPGPAPAAADDPGDPDAWFARLEAVLIGRHDVPPSRAAELVAEARAHVADAGSQPADEFPSLAEYARDLAASESVRQGPWWRGPLAMFAATAAVVLCWLVLVIEAAVDGQWWVAILGSFAAPLGARMLVERYQAVRAL
ncbi:hypothetical protein AB0M02_40375 [Actinoplanes sp. NPDC051861]|uniref:hypothetical protein n=1 Tax=Actinoplanes sp. NPDC051861 TaxID=3155170 RepID=UPI003435C5DA